MSSVELNAKKIETLTKVARLLGDQLREQNNKIEQIQKELELLKETIRAKNEESSIVQKDIKDLKLPEMTGPAFEEHSAPETAKLAQKTAKTNPISSEKEELKKALKIIEDL